MHTGFYNRSRNKHNFLSISPSMRTGKHLHSRERANPILSWELLYHGTKKHKKSLCYPQNSTGPFVTYSCVSASDHTAVTEIEFQTTDKSCLTSEWGSYWVLEQNPGLGDCGSKQSDGLQWPNTCLTSFYPIFPLKHTRWGRFIVSSAAPGCVCRHPNRNIGKSGILGTTSCQ